MASRDTAFAKGSHVPYVYQRFAATRSQGCPIGGENDRGEGTWAAFGCLGLFPGFPVPQPQAPIIAHTRQALSIWSKSHPADCPYATAERLDLSALSYVPEAHGAVSTARCQELAIVGSKGQGPTAPVCPRNSLRSSPLPDPTTAPSGHYSRKPAADHPGQKRQRALLRHVRSTSASPSA
jgi:hypothetical protein